MIKGIFTIAVGIAAVSLTRFLVAAIQEEHRRRDSVHHEHDHTRWEGEGGNVAAMDSTG